MAKSFAEFGFIPKLRLCESGVELNCRLQALKTRRIQLFEKQITLSSGSGPIRRFKP